LPKYHTMKLYSGPNVKVNHKLAPWLLYLQVESAQWLGPRTGPDMVLPLPHIQVIYDKNYKNLNLNLW
jgi:hypothetical protein